MPAGIWAPEEYQKLRRYDAETPYQPLQMFQCHQTDADSQIRRVCGGWAACHKDLLAPRVAVLDGTIDATTYETVTSYESPVPIFSSGSEAAAHGESGLANPTEEACRMISKIVSARGDLSTG